MFNIGYIPPVVKNLLIINFLLLFLTISGATSVGIDLNDYLGLHHWSSERFRPWQFVTYIFMHGSISHVFFNMFALYMFGKVLEQVWGAKRFLIYYLVTGIGAGVVQSITRSYEISLMADTISHYVVQPNIPAFVELMETNAGYLQLADGLSLGKLNAFINQWNLDPNNPKYIQESVNYAGEVLRGCRNLGTVGASGAVFGILLAFGMLFPNVQLMLLFPPIPIKAKYFVIGYGLIELYSGLSNNPGDNVAHFAHLGGMLFGFILIKLWKNTTNTYY